MHCIISREEYFTKSHQGIQFLKMKEDSALRLEVVKKVKKSKGSPVVLETLVRMNKNHFDTHVKLTCHLFSKYGIKAYKVINHPHLGLQLQIGGIYTEVELLRRCRDKVFRIRQLVKKLDDDRIFMRIESSSRSECKVY